MMTVYWTVTPLATAFASTRVTTHFKSGVFSFTSDIILKVMNSCSISHFHVNPLKFNDAKVGLTSLLIR